MRSSILLSLLILMYCSVAAQTVIHGKVVDDKTGEGIGFVTVSLLSASDSSFIKGQVSDSAGVFTLSGVPSSGKYLLQLVCLGYKKLYVPFPQAVIRMTADPNLLNEVTVTGEKPALQRVGDKLVVNIAGNKFFAASANALDILRKVPGIDVNGDGTILMSGRITPEIFIDGKPVLMSTDELQHYLAGLSPNMITSIEVINNPSSKYDGAYKGIIDIRLKRDLTLGWKGNVSVNIQRNAYTLANNNLLLTYKTKRTAYTVGLGYMAGTRIHRYSGVQYLTHSNALATNTHTPTRNNNLNYQLGVDYSLRKGQNIGIMLRAYQLNRTINSFNTLSTTDSSIYSYAHNNSGPKQYNYAANLNYTARAGEKQLDILGSIVKISNRQQEDIQNRSTATDRLLYHWKTVLRNDILIRMAQADLSFPFLKGKVNTGAKFSFVTTKNDLRYDTLFAGDVFSLDSSRTNNFQYDEYVTAAYASYERKWFTLSLRAEHTHSVTDVIKRSYLTWLPGFNITYKAFNLSFSRRITRPDFAQLNPFRFYNSPLNYFVGNPYLQASRTSMLSISYTKKTFTISLQAGRETDPMTRYPEYDSTTHILQYLGRNLPYNNFAGIEISFPVTINKWWRMNNNIRGAYKKEQTPYHGAVYKIPITDYTISGSQVFTLPKAITFDLSYYYRSYSGSGLYISRPIGNVDLGLQRSFMKGKLQAKINYYDIFDTFRVRFVFREKQIINNEFSHWFGNRRGAFTLNYSFGTSTHSGKQSRKNEEEGRAGM